MKAVLCPVCNGKGKVKPDWDSWDGKTLVTCHGCNGKGWVEISEDPIPCNPYPYIPWSPYPCYPWYTEPTTTSPVPYKIYPYYTVTISLSDNTDNDDKRY